MCDLYIEYNVTAFASKVNLWCKISGGIKMSGEKLIESVIRFSILPCEHRFFKFQLCKKKKKLYKQNFPAKNHNSKILRIMFIS